MGVLESIFIWFQPIFFRWSFFYMLCSATSLFSDHFMISAIKISQESRGATSQNYLVTSWGWWVIVEKFLLTLLVETGGRRLIWSCLAWGGLNFVKKGMGPCGKINFFGLNKPNYILFYYALRVQFKGFKRSSSLLTMDSLSKYGHLKFDLGNW